MPIETGGGPTPEEAGIEGDQEATAEPIELTGAQYELLRTGPESPGVRELADEKGIVIQLGEQQVTVDGRTFWMATNPDDFGVRVVDLPPGVEETRTWRHSYESKEN